MNARRHRRAADRDGGARGRRGRVGRSRTTGSGGVVLRVVAADIERSGETLQRHQRLALDIPGRGAADEREREEHRVKKRDAATRAQESTVAARRRERIDRPRDEREPERHGLDAKPEAMTGLDRLARGKDELADTAHVAGDDEIGVGPGKTEIAHP